MNFTALLKNIRTEEGISLDQLALGIMSASQLARIEKGERSVAKVVRDRLLERLGVARDLYENLLDLEDYREWERQKDILHAVREKQTKEAEQLLSEYEESLEDDENIRRQFYLVMLADIQKKVEGQELFVRKCYREALALTVPEADTVWAKQRPLSILEINLLLENLAYENGMDSFLKYKVLLHYVEDGCYDEISKAKIYPKIAFYSLKKGCSIESIWMPGSGWNVWKSAGKQWKDCGMRAERIISWSCLRSGNSCWKTSWES